MTRRRGGTPPTLPDLAALGITYRQLDYWTHRGYIQAKYHSQVGARRAEGTGSRRLYDDTELAVAQRIGRLTAAGIELDRAAEIARCPTGWLIDLAPGIRIWIDEPQPAQQKEAAS